eukprot:7877318-Pyramimonas_sp.AAC.1
MGAVPGRSLQRESRISTQQGERYRVKLWAHDDWNTSHMLIGLRGLLNEQRRHTRNRDCPRGCCHRARGRLIY